MRLISLILLLSVAQVFADDKIEWVVIAHPSVKAESFSQILLYKIFTNSTKVIHKPCIAYFPKNRDDLKSERKLMDAFLQHAMDDKEVSSYSYYVETLTKIRKRAPKNTKIVKSFDEVIKYVRSTRYAIGVIPKNKIPDGSEVKVGKIATK